MRNFVFVGVVLVVAMCAGVAAAPAMAAPASDACALLTAEQVGDAVGANVGGVQALLLESRRRARGLRRASL